MSKSLLGALSVSLLMSGCGTVIPQMHLAKDTPAANAVAVNSIVTHVHCELRRAVFYAYDELKKRRNVEWLKEWAAKITLTMTVDERSAVSPGISATNHLTSFRDVLPNGEIISGPRSFELGLGGSLSSNAVREQEITWFLVFTDIFEERQHANQPCSQKAFLQGDLKIKEGLLSGLFPASLERNMSDPFQRGGRLQVIQHQVSFSLEASGNATPSWNLVAISANTGNPFLSSTRNRKDNLLITMGPTQLAEAGRDLRVRRIVPSAPVESSHLAKQFGNSVGTGLLGLR